MLIEVIVEEASMERTLRHLIPKVRPEWSSPRFINCKGRDKLLKTLPGVLHSYAMRAQHDLDFRVMVLIDNDGGDCEALKMRLEDMARQAGLMTKSEAGGGNFTAVNRIVIEELESWFLGDPQAIRKAFENLPGSFEEREPYRNPEQNGAWETLQRLLNEHRYYADVEPFPKYEVADLVAPHMNIEPGANRAASFDAFIEGLRACV